MIAVKAELSLALEKTNAGKKRGFTPENKENHKITSVFQGLLLTRTPKPYPKIES